MKTSIALLAVLALLVACSSPPKTIVTRPIRIESGSLAEISITKGIYSSQPVGMTPITIQYPVNDANNSNFGIIVKFMSDNSRVELDPYLFGPMVENKSELFIPAPYYGDAPDKNTAIELIKADLETRLTDPTSVMFKWGDFHKQVYGTQYCWMLEFLVNAKNSYGGYVGWRTAYATFCYRKLLNVGIDEPR